MRLLLLTVLLSACKLISTSSDDLRSLESHAVFLNVTPAGMLIEVAGALGPGGNVPLPQAFYRLRTAKQEFEAEHITAQPLQAVPVVFSEVVLAWQSQGYTWVCFLKDVTGSRSIEPMQEVCYRQPNQYDYLRQFVEWCVRDNKYDSPFFISGERPYCKVGKTSASNTVRIPLRCFAGNANRCFPPEKRSKAARERRNDQRIPDKDFKPRDYYIAKYLSESGKTFTALLDDIYAQASDCRDGAGMEVRIPTQAGHPFYCNCPGHKNKKITLNGEPRSCGATGSYHFFPRL